MGVSVVPPARPCAFNQAHTGRHIICALIHTDQPRGHAWLYSYRSPDENQPDEDYLEELKGMAEYFGLDEEIVELLRKEGFTFTEIEEMLYDPEMLDAYLTEVMGEYHMTRMY